MTQSDTPDEDEIQKLVENATDVGSWQGGGVTSEKLTDLKCGFILKEKPLIEYLDDGEQPEYIYRSSGSIGPAVKANLGDEAVALIQSNKSAICITDKRVLVIGRGDDGDITLSLRYDGIHSVEWDKLAMVNPFGRTNHTITLFVDPMVITSGGVGADLNKNDVVGVIDEYIAIDIGLPNKYSNRVLKKPVNYIKQKINSVQTNTKYLSESGVRNESDQSAKLRDLKELLDDGVIDEDEFKSKKEELLDQI